MKLWKLIKKYEEKEISDNTKIRICVRSKNTEEKPTRYVYTVKQLLNFNIYKELQYDEDVEHHIYTIHEDDL